MEDSILLNFPCLFTQGFINIRLKLNLRYAYLRQVYKPSSEIISPSLIY